jgi:mono/diheme cytochrome c family protein
MKSHVFALPTILAALLLISSQPVLAGDEANAKLLFERKCGTCHSIEKPKSKTKIKGEWEKTVMRMKNVNMASISNEEAKAITDYLTNTYGKTK